MDRTGGYNFDNACLVENKPLTKSNNEDTQTTTYYSTPMWIFPPHSFGAYPFGSTYWPKVIIEIQDEDENQKTQYAGFLPARMKYYTKDNVFDNISLEFMSGYHLIIDVKLVKDFGNPELLFGDIQVWPWSRVMTDNPTINESGINDWSDLVALVEEFNENSSETNYRLMRYGNWDKNQWKFKLWKDIEIPTNVQPLFESDKFEIDFGEHIIVIQNTEVNAENYKIFLCSKN